MKGSFLMMAMAMAMMGSTSMNGGNQRTYTELPEEKKILPGRFKGMIPKGCKLETVEITVTHREYRLTQKVDIVFGSLKAKEKAVRKAEWEIKNYLTYRSKFAPKNFDEFDQVEYYSVSDAAN
jgi:hypothetical protein